MMKTLLLMLALIVGGTLAMLTMGCNEAAPGSTPTTVPAGRLIEGVVKEIQLHPGLVNPVVVRFDDGRFVILQYPWGNKAIVFKVGVKNKIIMGDNNWIDSVEIVE